MNNQIYIAGSFATQEEKDQLYKMINWVRETYPDTKLFIPMEHFVPGGNDKDEYGNYIMPNDVWGKRVFMMDLEGLEHSDMVVNLYRGRISGTGTAWELGYAFAKGMPIIQWIPEEAEIASVMCYNCATVHMGKVNIEQK